MKEVIHRLNSSSENAGHWQCSVALAVLLGKVSARLRKEPTNTFGKPATTPPLTPEPPGDWRRDRGCPRRLQAFWFRLWSTALMRDSWANQLTHDVWGSSRPLLGIGKESESKRKRLSVNQGTSEARLSMVVTTLERSSDWPKRLPMRQSSGGAPVVVGDVNDDHMAKGCRMIRVWVTEMFFILEASK